METAVLLAIKWLILLYLIQTCAELCLSPIGLSLVGKLSPKRFSSLLYGVFFLSNASGYALAGTLGSIIPATGDKFIKAKELGIDLQGVLDKTVTPTAEQLELLETNQISDHNPIFAGFEIHNLFEFFMVFVVLMWNCSNYFVCINPIIEKNDARHSIIFFYTYSNLQLLLVGLFFNTIHYVEIAP